MAILLIEANTFLILPLDLGPPLHGDGFQLVSHLIQFTHYFQYFMSSTSGGHPSISRQIYFPPARAEFVSKVHSLENIIGTSAAVSDLRAF